MTHPYPTAQWLAELRADGVAFTDAYGGANQDLWSLSVFRGDPISADELVTFVLAAAAIRKDLVAKQSVSPATFYAWHDTMAGQLRFSTAQCTPNSLPFSAEVHLVLRLEEIVEPFLAWDLRDGIPWATLRGTDEYSQADGQVRDEPLRVWAQRLA